MPLKVAGWRRALRRALPLAAAVGLLAGCSTYANQSTRIRAHADGGDLHGAIAEVRKEAGDDPDVLSLLQEGLLAYYVGDYRTSVATFDSAAVMIDDQFTKSISTEALAFLSNDQSRPYDGYPGEQALLHIYAALAYLADGNRRAALVEVRAASTQLERLEQVRENRETYTRDPFAEWIAAMLYANDEDANACLVSCRRALAAYEDAGEAWDQPMPEGFLDDYARWADRFGFPEERIELEEKYGERGMRARRLSPDEGEVVLLFESGWVSHLEEVRLSFPILEGDDFDDDEVWASQVMVRGHRETYAPSHDLKIAYWLDVAWPVLAWSETSLVGARMIAAEDSTYTEQAHDISAVFEVTFEEGSGTRALRTIMRALAKYAAVEAIDDDEDETRQLLSFIANLFAAGTEVADTRSWTMLPDRIHLARLRLPAGSHTVRVEVLDLNGSVGQTLEFTDVRIVPRSRTLIHHRSFR
jgi:hypothetical protein